MSKTQLSWNTSAACQNWGILLRKPKQLSPAAALSLPVLACCCNPNVHGTVHCILHWGACYAGHSPS